jgi:RNA polymerase sigma-70 factor (ECF subfamily)
MSRTTSLLPLLPPTALGAVEGGLQMADGAEKARGEDSRAEDMALVAAALGGGEDAFRRLVEKHQKAVYWVAYDVLLDADEAKDVAQETFLRVHGALASFDPGRSFVNWLYRIAKNIAIDALRRRRRRGPPVDDLTALPARERPDPGQQAEVRERVAAVLAELPLEYRLALTLKEFHGLTPRQIAEVTDCGYATARWRLHRARSLFRKAWLARFGDEDGEPTPRKRSGR